MRSCPRFLWILCGAFYGSSHVIPNGPSTQDDLSEFDQAGVTGAEEEECAAPNVEEQADVSSGEDGVVV